MGKMLFGNTAGLQNNFTGTIKKILLTRTNKEFDKSINTLATELKNKGYLKLECPYDNSLIKGIKTKYDNMIEDDKYSSLGSEYEGKVYSRFFFHAHKYIQELAYLLTNDIISIIEAYYGGYFKVKHVTFWRNYYVPAELVTKKEMFSNNWHCDRRETDILKLFVNLSDVADKNGPFHIQSRKRTKELIKGGFGTRADYKLPVEVLEDPNYVVKGTGPIGTVMIANTEVCLHRAGTPDKGEFRDMIQFQFVPSKKPLPSDWINEVSADVQEQRMMK
jgi:hypothetical protein